MSSAQDTMRVAVYYNNQTVLVEESPVPQVGAGELLVKTVACGLCGGEAMEWYLAPRAPKVLGHEPVGIVVDVGQGVTKFKKGDRVFVHHHVACMSCHFCNRGYFSMCERFSQTRIVPGGFAEYFKVSAENADLDTYILPEEVSFEEGTMIEPLACALRGFMDIKVHPGDTVAIVGVGFMGMGFVKLSQLFPFARIVALDLNDWRLEQARRHGATHGINPNRESPVDVLRDLNRGRLADMVIVTSPSAKAWVMALELCEKGGKFHYNAPPPPDELIRLSYNELYFREIKIYSTYSASHIETRAILDLMTTKRLDTSGLITHRFGLDNVAEAIALLLQGGESLKSLIIP